MQPCGGGGDGEAVGALLQPQGPAAQATAESHPAQGSLMLLYELGPAGDAEADGESAASPGGCLDEADDEDESGAQAGDGCKNCAFQGCHETTSQLAKQRKPWMCKRHRNKMYKDKYKRKKSDQAQGAAGPGAAAAQAAAAGGAGGGGGGGPAGSARVEDGTENSGSASRQRTGSVGDRPTKPTLLEQVLNHKRLSLLRSPEVVNFLQKHQQLLSQQASEQRQQQFPGAPM